MNNVHNTGYTALSFSETAVPSGTVTNVQTLELTKGLYLIQISAYWTGNTSGYRQIGLATTTTGQNIDRYSIARVNALNSTTATTYQQFTFIFNVSSTSSTYYINVYQNSGSTLNINGGHKRVKLK